MEAEELTKLVEDEREGKLDPFDRHVAMTMVIIAALLALITLESHRTDTEVLNLQLQAANLRTQANIYHTRASDEWAYYQAKNVKSTEYQGFLALLDAMPASAVNGDHKSQDLHQNWEAKVRKYENTELPQLKAGAEQLVNQALRYEGQSSKALQGSYEAHFRGERLDLAELAVEMALVLCSLAVLTKGAAFWYAGIGASVVGAVIGVAAIML